VARGAGSGSWVFAVRRDGGRIVRPTGRRYGGFVHHLDGREGAGAEGREEVDQQIEDAEKREADLHREDPHQQSLVTARGDGLAHVVEGTLQSVVGVRREGAGHLKTPWFG
jgi:hypothetical protein